MHAPAAYNDISIQSHGVDPDLVAACATPEMNVSVGFCSAVLLLPHGQECSSSFYYASHAAEERAPNYTPRTPQLEPAAWARRLAERVASAATSGWSTGCGAKRLNVAGAFPFWCQAWRLCLGYFRASHVRLQMRIGAKGWVGKKERRFVDVGIVLCVQRRRCMCVALLMDGDSRAGLGCV